MIVGVLSDTHDRMAGIDQAINLLQDHGATVILHCGDWTRPETLGYLAHKAAMMGIPVHGVMGNRDDQPLLAAYNQSVRRPIGLPDDNELLRLSLGGRKAAVYHGHHKPTLRRLLADTAIEVLFTGHSHKPLIQELDGKLLINPGSTAFSIPRRREPRSVALYDSKAHQARLLFFDI